VSESQLAHTGDHLTVYAARGSHATYDSCGKQHRSKAPGGLIDDRPQCDPARQLALEPEITPLSDLALAPWACWQGRFGHVPSGRIESAADLYFAAGPRSPLWQQKFGPRGTRAATPCAAVRDEPDRPDAGEEVLSDGVGKQLRDNGGRLDKLFDTCPAWRNPPSAGVYVVACDGRALAGFFKSGLEDTGDREISIRGAGQKPEPASIPAVYRRTDAVSPEGVSISAKQPATVSIYAVCYSGDERIEASFPAVRLTPARAVTLRIGDRTWTLTGLATPATTTPQTKANTARCRG